MHHVRAVLSLAAFSILHSPFSIYGAPPATTQPAAVGPTEWSAPTGKMDTSIVRESSGIAKSNRYDGIYWTHNDSGNPAELFAVTLDGRTVARFPVLEAHNIDWEDIAVEDGYIYVGDIGNNFGWFKSRTVYKIAEPDPYAPDSKPLRPESTLRYGYPGETFDAEGLVVRGGRVFVVEKSRRSPSTVYWLKPTDGGAAELVPVCKPKAASITGADLSPDGRYLAVTSTWLLVRYAVNEDLSLREDEPPMYVRYPFGGGIEACCFDGEDVIVTNEAGSIYRIPRQVIETQRPFEGRKP